MLRQKLSTAWHFGQSGIWCAAVVEGSTRIAANAVRRASFIGCFQVTYSGWAEILLKADLSKPDDRLEDSLTKATSDRDDPAAAPSPLGKPSACRHRRPPFRPTKNAERRLPGRVGHATHGTWIPSTRDLLSQWLSRSSRQDSEA
jgi:hypothetical protein